jgi:hypothetical protein
MASQTEHHWPYSTSPTATECPVKKFSCDLIGSPTENNAALHERRLPTQQQKTSRFKLLCGFAVANGVVQLNGQGKLPVRVPVLRSEEVALVSGELQSAGLFISPLQCASGCL